MDDLTHPDPHTEFPHAALPAERDPDLPAVEQAIPHGWWTGQRKFGAALLVAIALAAILPPWINVNRFRRDVAAGISGSLGRPVHLDHVGLRLLPSPAFIIDNFVVGENPAFGAEPVMLSSSVVATLHISSLWRGRLEFASISLDEPSVNLVRNPQGGWNVESILLQAAQIATAPTAQKRAGSLPRFPYIEAENARVNIKLGDEKMPLSFTDAQFELWLSGPGRWQVRMKAHPLRTDMDLSDTGTITVEGDLGRAASVSLVPLQLRAEWKDAQLGEVTRLLTGQDMGWRGQLEATAEARGTIGDAHLTTRTGVTGLRREEFFPDRQLELRMECAAQATGNFNAISAIGCNLPVGHGSLSLSGSIADMKTAPHPRFALQVQQVPAAEMLNLLRHASNVIAPELTADGALNGEFNYGEGLGATMAPASIAPVAPVGTHRVAKEIHSAVATPAVADTMAGWSGQATLPTLTIRSPQWTRPLVLSGLRLVAGVPADDATTTANSKPASAAVPRHAPAGGLYLQAVDLPLGAATPSVLDGRFGRQGYVFHASGPAALARLLELDAALHFFGEDIQGLQPIGNADLDISLQGPWERPLQPDSLLTPAAQQPLRLSSLTGSVRLKGAHLRFRQASGETSTPDGSSAKPSPLDPGEIGLTSAHLQFTPDAVQWDQVAGIYDGFHFEGEGTRPLFCPSSQVTAASGQTNAPANIPGSAPAAPLNVGPGPAVPPSSAAGTASPSAGESAPVDVGNCAITFDLTAAVLDARKVAAALSAAPARKSLLDLLPWKNKAAPNWPAARGTLRVAAFSVGPWSMRNAVARIAMRGDRAALESLDARTLNGDIHATGSLNAAAPNWQYQMNASLQNAQLAAASALLRRSFASGSGNAHCTLRMTSGEKNSLAQSAEGTCDWSLDNGALNVTPKPEEPASETARRPANLPPFTLPFQHWNGSATVGHGSLTIVSGTATDQHGTVAVSGTVGLNRSADLTWGSQRILGRLGTSDGASGVPEAQPPQKLQSPQKHKASGTSGKAGASLNGK